MSSCSTYPWSIYCDSHWELICCNKCHPGTSEIPTPPEITAETHFHLQHGIKNTLALLLADWEAFCSLVPSSVYYQTAKWNQNTPIPLSSRWQVRSEKAKKRRSINTLSPVSTDLTIKSDSVLMNPIRMGCEAGLGSKTRSRIMTPSLEGWPTKAKERLSPHEVKLDTNPVF